MLTACRGDRELAQQEVEQAVPLGIRAFHEQEAHGVSVGAKAIIGRIFGRPDPDTARSSLLPGDYGRLAGVPFFDVRNALVALVAGDPEAARAAVRRWTPRLDEVMYDSTTPATSAGSHTSVTFRRWSSPAVRSSASRPTNSWSNLTTLRYPSSHGVK